MFGKRKYMALIEAQNEKLDILIGLMSSPTVQAPPNAGCKKVKRRTKSQAKPKAPQGTQPMPKLDGIVTNKEPIKFNQNERFSSVRFQDGSKSAAYERLMWAIQKRGGKSTVKFTGLNMKSKHQRHKATGAAYAVAQRLGLRVSMSLTDEAKHQGDDVILIAIE